jgi:hypothetical protein
MQCRKVSRDKYNKREREKRDKLCPQSLTHTQEQSKEAADEEKDSGGVKYIR